ncbi:MAG TPA: methyltransferase domain-containing protein [Actinomycetota bacterium]
MGEEYGFDQSWEQEKQRLRYLEQWLDPGTFRHLKDLGLGAGSQCLEVGGGHGSVARGMADRVGGNGRVLVTDIDTNLLTELASDTVEVQTHDITTGPPEPEAFDIAHARMVVGWIREREKALQHMIEALKPGGLLVIEELDQISQISIQPSECYERVIAASDAAMKMVGYDMQLGRRLPWVLHELGLEGVSAEGRVVYGSYEDSPGLGMYRLTLERMREPLKAVGSVTDEDIEETLRILFDPDFEKMPPTIVAAWGRKPA